MELHGQRDWGTHLGEGLSPPEKARELGSFSTNFCQLLGGGLGEGTNAQAFLPYTVLDVSSHTRHRCLAVGLSKQSYATETIRAAVVLESAPQ